MPSYLVRGFYGTCLRAVFAAGTLFAVNTNAAALGDIHVQSFLGQPLQAEIKVIAVSDEEAGALSAKLASIEAFRRASMAFNPALQALQFKVVRRSEGYFIHVSSDAPIQELSLSLLLELSGEGSRLMREYTFFLDPPESDVALAYDNNHRNSATPVIVHSTVDYPVTAVAPAKVARSTAPERAFFEGTAKVPARVVLPEQGQAGQQAYRITDKDFLGGIASRFKSDDISVYQMMVAIYRTNPDAFVGNNINRLRVGRTIVIPDGTIVRNIDQIKARALVIEQGKAYRDGVGDMRHDATWQDSQP